MSAVPPRVVRRCLIDPLWPAVVVGLSAVLLVPVVVAAVLAPLTRRRRVLRLSALAIVYLWLDVRLLVGAWVLWLRQPTSRRDEDIWRGRHAALLGRALGVLTVAARRLLGFTVAVDDQRPDAGAGPAARLADAVAAADRPLVVLARHAGPGDSFTLVHLLITRYGRRPRVVLKQALQWDPGLDIVLTRLACYFLPSPSGAGDDRTAAVARMAADLDPVDALLLFPEGGNWTPRRHRRAVVRLLRAGHRRRAQRARAMAHVLPPRPGGAVASLTVRDDTDVLVVAHRGLDRLVNPRSMWEALPLRDRPMQVHPWWHAAPEVPRDEAAALHWLDARWAEVEAWVAPPRIDPARPDPPAHDDGPTGGPGRTVPA